MALVNTSFTTRFTAATTFTHPVTRAILWHYIVDRYTPLARLERLPPRGRDHTGGRRAAAPARWLTTLPTAGDDTIGPMIGNALRKDTTIGSKPPNMATMPKSSMMMPMNDRFNRTRAMPRKKSTMPPRFSRRLNGLKNTAVRLHVGEQRSRAVRRCSDKHRPQNSQSLRLEKRHKVLTPIL